MKQKDIALVVVIVVISGVISLFASKAIFASPKNTKQKAEVVQSITPSFPEPNKRYFNDKSFNPTKQITIEQNSNTDPFSDNKQ